MQTVTTHAPSIMLAIECQDSSEHLKTQLSEQGCRVRKYSNLADLERHLKTEVPALAIVSLDFEEPCALQFCQDHPQLLVDIPVVFLVSDPTESFEKSLKAIRLGALDVLVGPLEFAELEKIVSQAERSALQRAPSCEVDSPPQKSASQSTGAGNQHVDRPLSSGLNIHRKIAKRDFNSRGQSGQSEVSSNRQPTHPAVQVRPFQPIGKNDHVAGTPAKSPLATSDSTNGSLGTTPHREANHRSMLQAARVKELETWILGSSPAMQSIRRTIAEVADTKASVMISGASGTGKELVASALHKLSARSRGPFEPVNMTEIPHDLAESLLFGHERGAFTSAESRQIGVCEAADGGTLFLDEIGEMALATQPKLLRFLQEGTVKRIGSRTFKNVDVRVITATNRDPETIVQKGLMREDLFFRLHVVPIHIPSLVERPEDIEQLALLFLRRYNKAYDRNVQGFSEEALDVFRRHDWPGNVRQLENVVERLVVFAKTPVIDVSDIPADIHAASMFGPAFDFRVDPGLDAEENSQKNGSSSRKDHDSASGHPQQATLDLASMTAMQRTERAAIVEALHRADGHVIDAANLLGLGQATVYRKIKLYQIPHVRRRRRRTPK